MENDQVKNTEMVKGSQPVGNPLSSLKAALEDTKPQVDAPPVLPLPKAGYYASDKTVVLDFGGEVITLPLFEIEAVEGRTIQSISRIMPMDKAVLVAEYGKVGMMNLLSHIESNQPLSAKAKLAIVGVGTNVPYHIPLGVNFYPKMRDTHLMRGTFDPSNQLSFDSLATLAKKDKELVAGIAIAREKSRSRVGLNVQSQLIDTAYVQSLKDIPMGNKGNQRYKQGQLYKDKELIFVNYFLMEYTNIDAIIYDN